MPTHTAKSDDGTRNRKITNACKVMYGKHKVPKTATSGHREEEEDGA
jgi:hypothetical protein